jgi:pSer/pThr/pTyr-binding forkhead associated (FHA) protein
MAGLCLLDENGAIAQWWELGDKPVAFGRGNAADVTIPDDALSRRHFLVWQEGESFRIKDLNSQNGTWVDGQRMQMTELRHDVCIVAGRTVFMFGNHRPGVGTAVAKPQEVLSGTGRILPAVLTS